MRTLASEEHEFINLFKTQRQSKFLSSFSKDSSTNSKKQRSSANQFAFDLTNLN